MMSRGILIDISRIDFLLLVGVLLLLIIGLSSVYSSSSYKAEKATGNSFYYFINQLLRVVIGLVLMTIIAAVDYRNWLGLAPIMYFVSIVLLLLLFSGQPFVVQVQEAKRWLRFGGITFQPSDIARYALIMMMARVLVKKHKTLDNYWKGFMKYNLLIVLVVVLVGLEKDLGSAILIALVAFSMLYFAEIRISYLLSVVLTFTSGAMAFMMANIYQLKRVTTFIIQLLQGMAVDYQLKQSMISFALGGFAVYTHYLSWY